MRRTNKIKRQGFTLVELLIVIVVIGILSAMMMLSSTEATTSARASNIVTNLRNLTTAALAYYTDNMDAFSSGLELTKDTAGVADVSGNYLPRLIKYLKAGGNTTTGGLDSEFTDYEFVNGTNNAWYVGYTGASDTRIQDKLKGRAASVQLLKDTNQTQYTTGKNVYMLVLGEPTSTGS